MARILVVDDEPDVRELFNITLKMAGHTTETAKDGLEAVDRLQGDIPDLILLDLMMPRMDGFGLLTHIREKMDTRPVRVLVATAKVLEEADHSRLGSWPVVGVLNKGELDISAMVNIVRTALSKEALKPAASAEQPKESPAPPTVQPSPAPPAETPVAPPTPPPPAPSAAPASGPASPPAAAPPAGPGIPLINVPPVSTQKTSDPKKD